MNEVKVGVVMVLMRSGVWGMVVVFDLCVMCSVCGVLMGAGGIGGNTMWFVRLSDCLWF